MPARRSRGPLRFLARAASLPLLGLVCLAAAGCGGDSDDSQPSNAETRHLEIQEQPSGSQQALTSEPVDGDFRGISFQAYNESLNETISLLNQYWATELPKRFGTPYTPPSDLIAYYPSQGVPKCAGEPAEGGNAYYCAANNSIAWDEPGLMIPFYAEVGDA